MLSGVTVIGFIGYLLLGLGAFDSLYMTVITITTVGFSEIGAPDEITAAYQTSRCYSRSSASVLRSTPLASRSRRLSRVPSTTDSRSGEDSA